jgi:hypothetical protein
MRMDDSAARFLIAIGFNIVVAVVFYVFGSGLMVAWFTFLALTGFAALGEIGQALDSIARKLDALSKVKTDLG